MKVIAKSDKAFIVEMDEDEIANFVGKLRVNYHGYESDYEMGKVQIGKTYKVSDIFAKARGILGAYESIKGAMKQTNLSVGILINAMEEVEPKD